MLILTPTNYTELFSAFNLQACCWMNPEEEVKRENPIYRVITNIELLTQKQKSYIYVFSFHIEGQKLEKYCKN